MTSTTDIDRPGDTAAPVDEPSLNLDQISLEQALLDFDVANARVIDLTRRLVDASEELNRLRHEVELLRPEAEAARGSRAYGLIRKLRGVLRYLRQ